MKAMRVCSTPGCPNLVERSGPCGPCRTAADTRPSRHARGYDHRWTRTRARHLRHNPDCVWCGEPGNVVDHIDGLGPLGPRGHDLDNLRTMCASCHGRRTAQDQPGGWNR